MHGVKPKNQCNNIGIKNSSKLKNQQPIDLIENPDFRISLGKRTIGKKQRELLWSTYLGKDSRLGQCYACNNELDILYSEAGHVIAFEQGGTDNIDNLRPICVTCNRGMGTENLEEYKEKITSLAFDDKKILIQKNGLFGQRYNNQKYVPIELVESKYIRLYDAAYILKRDLNINFDRTYIDYYKPKQLYIVDCYREELKKLGFTIHRITDKEFPTLDHICVLLEDFKTFYIKNKNN